MRWQAVRELRWEWDPLEDNDPADPHLPTNEYDWLVPGVNESLTKALTLAVSSCT